MAEKPEKYATYGMRVQCSAGTMENYISTDVGHGVNYQGNPLLNANDHVKGVNLTHFGDCHAKGVYEEAKAEIDSMFGNVPGAGIGNPANVGALLKGIITVKECLGLRKCDLDVPKPWINTNDDHILDGAPALTLDSICTCRYGGVISFVQEAVDSEAAIEAATVNVAGKMKAGIMKEMEEAEGVDEPEETGTTEVIPESSIEKYDVPVVGATAEGKEKKRRKNQWEIYRELKLALMKKAINEVKKEQEEQLQKNFKIMESYLRGEVGVNEFEIAKEYVAANGGQTEVGEFVTGGFANVEDANRFDETILAWTNFWNVRMENKLGEGNFTPVRAELVKAIIAEESSMGTDSRFNATLNVMQALSPGDPCFWVITAMDPTKEGKTHFGKTEYVIYVTDIDGNEKYTDGSWIEGSRYGASGSDKEKEWFDNGSWKAFADIIGEDERTGEYRYYYKRVNHDLGIVAGIGWLAYKTNVENGRLSEAEGVWRYNGSDGQEEYVNEINMHLQEINPTYSLQGIKELAVEEGFEVVESDFSME